jgi:peptidoglycan/xylan/chitin deacetylase (PgdA/CDA1 family)
MTPDTWIINEGTVLDPCDNVAGWVVASGAGVMSLDVYHYQQSNASIQIANTVADGDTYIEKRNLSLDLSEMETLQVRIFVSQTQNYTSDIFRIAFFTNNISPYKFMEKTWVYLRSGWNTFTVAVDEMTAYNGINLATEPVVKIRLGAFSGSNSTLILSVDEIRINQKNKPVCLLTFDDGRKNIAENALPIMQDLEAEHGVRIPGTMYLCKLHADLGEGGNPLYLTYDQVRALANARWCIANHTLTHPDFLTITKAEIIAEIRGMTNWLLDMGYERGGYHLAFPHGHGGPTVFSALSQCGVLSAREVSGGNWRTSAFFRYKMWANTSLGLNYMGLTDAKAKMLHAKNYGEICVLTIHGVSDTPTTEELTTVEFRELLEYGVELGMLFLTIDELIDGMSAMHALFVYRIDAALEKCNRRPYRLDAIISNQKYSGFIPLNTVPWDVHFVKPADHPVF